MLTGSTSGDALPAGTQTLTGRLHVVPNRPLSQIEVGSGTALLPALLDGPADLRRHDESATSRSSYVAAVLAGGFPTALLRAGAARARSSTTT